VSDGEQGEGASLFRILLFFSFVLLRSPHCRYPPLSPFPQQATVVNPLASHGPLLGDGRMKAATPTTDVEVEAGSAGAPQAHTAPAARAAAAVVLGHAAAFWGLFLGVGTRGQVRERAVGRAGWKSESVPSPCIFSVACCFLKLPRRNQVPPSHHSSGAPLIKNKQPAAVVAATAAYEATALLTAAALVGLWAWSRRRRAAAAEHAASTPPLLSIPALAVLFGLQWPAFTFLMVSACCGQR